MQATKEQFKVLNELFNYYNKALFNNRLPDCIVGFSRVRGMAGAFIPDTWKEKNGEEPIHEIVLNANIIGTEDIIVHSILVHEMCHLHVDVFGKRAKWGYHTQQWSACMKMVGLHPSHNGLPGGKETGRKMMHYVIKDGLFERAFIALCKKDLTKYKIPYDAYRKLQIRPNSENKKRGGKRSSYVCPCGNKLWAKNGLSLHCNVCEEDFIIISDK